MHRTMRIWACNVRPHFLRRWNLCGPQPCSRWISVTSPSGDDLLLGEKPSKLTLPTHNQHDAEFMDRLLTDKERQIFSLLLKVQQNYSPDTVLRVAGGWVRNKLLGIDAGDIDIALDNLTGEQFAQHLVAYQQTIGVELSSIGLVQANPSQSKHLASATTKILEEHIDFVHLRTETYHENTRIPVAKMGSPKEDALRRDFTVNSLFYNLNTSMIEDLTGRGITDLTNGFLRTPLPPLETFQDDPLRMLRSIRFACRYKFSIDPAIVEASLSDVVQSSFRKKISKDRIGIELKKMLGDKNYSRACGLLKHLNLLDSILCPSAHGPPPSLAIDLSAVKHLPLVLKSTFSSTTWLDLKVDHQQHLIVIAALMSSALSNSGALPVLSLCTKSEFSPRNFVATGIEYLEMVRNYQIESLNPVAQVVKDHLKWSKAESRTVHGIVAAAHTFPLGNRANFSPTLSWQDELRLFLWMRKFKEDYAGAFAIMIAQSPNDDDPQRLNSSFDAFVCSDRVRSIAESAKDAPLSGKNLRNKLDKEYYRHIAVLLQILDANRSVLTDDSIDDDALLAEVKDYLKHRSLPSS